ncbi:hypothetical protein Tco_0772184 [Tanacetum coccineum]|uniref:Uncharacterized protein n=1 Tax=Tanacetum coccineum TaxID=301880 RepID=A0ABQ4ZH68_9ASTR
MRASALIRHHQQLDRPMKSDGANSGGPQTICTQSAPCLPTQMGPAISSWFSSITSIESRCEDKLGSSSGLSIVTADSLGSAQDEKSGNSQVNDAVVEAKSSSTWLTPQKQSLTSWQAHNLERVDLVGPEKRPTTYGVHIGIPGTLIYHDHGLGDLMSGLILKWEGNLRVCNPRFIRI